MVLAGSQRILQRMRALHALKKNARHKMRTETSKRRTFVIVGRGSVFFFGQGVTQSSDSSACLDISAVESRYELGHVARRFDDAPRNIPTKAHTTFHFDCVLVFVEHLCVCDSLSSCKRCSILPRPHISDIKTFLCRIHFPSRAQHSCSLHASLSFSLLSLCPISFFPTFSLSSPMSIFVCCFSLVFFSFSAPCVLFSVPVFLLIFDFSSSSVL